MNNFENKQIDNLTSITAEVTPEKLSVDPAPVAVLAAKEETNPGVFHYTFDKPVSYNGAPIAEMTFDMESLTGQDSLNISAELQAMGKTALIPAFSDDYKVLMLARASSPRVGADFFASIPMKAFLKITGAARSFLL